MRAVALISAKGSPGVTTTALAFTAVANSSLRAADFAPSVLVETDPAGGDLECWCGPLGEAGLAGVAASSGEAPYERLGIYSTEAVPGVRAVVAPTTAAPMATILRSGMGQLTEAVRQWPGTAFVDVGRCDLAGEPLVNEFLDEMSLVVVVCRPSLASVEHTRCLVARRQRLSGNMAAVVVGGTRPYGPTDIASALGVPVLDVIPWDPRGVTSLIERGPNKSWLRSPLATASARCLADLLNEQVPGVQVRRRQVHATD